MVPSVPRFKVKVKLSLCLTKHHTMKAYWASGVTAPLILFTSALDGNEWSASRPCRFIRRERVSGTHWIGWMGPRAVLDSVVKRKFPSPHREANPRTPIVQPVAQRYTDGAITALHDLSLSLFNDDVPKLLRLYSVKWDGEIRRCIQKFPDWPPGVRTANGTALCH
jgi:hypothetical protein